MLPEGFEPILPQTRRTRGRLHTRGLPWPWPITTRSDISPHILPSITLVIAHWVGKRSEGKEKKKRGKKKKPGREGKGGGENKECFWTAVSGRRAPSYASGDTKFAVSHNRHLRLFRRTTLNPFRVLSSRRASSMDGMGCTLAHRNSKSAGIDCTAVSNKASSFCKNGR